MRDTYTCLHTHIIWTTWDRAPLIKDDREGDIYAVIQSECRDMKAFVKAIGGTENHVHVLVDVPPSVSIANLAKQMKAVSSLMVNTQFGPRGCFKWQGAYGAFAVSRNDVDTVTAYIRNQKEHHAMKTTIADLEWDS
jgi:putative transposase